MRERYLPQNRSHPKLIGDAGRVVTAAWIWHGVGFLTRPSIAAVAKRDQLQPFETTMNCDNCAAPLWAMRQGKSFLCTYCGSHQVLQHLHLGADGVVDLHQFSEHDCPACGQRLHSALMDESAVEYCPACHGVLLAGDLFAHVVENRRREYRGAEERPAPIEPEQFDIRRDCPGCRQRMETHPYYGPGNTLIDSCYRCDLIWLDAGEPVALVKAPGRR
jgi:Zn-finger nucleic acid-binding protein